MFIIAFPTCPALFMTIINNVNKTSAQQNGHLKWEVDALRVELKDTKERSKGWLQVRISLFAAMRTSIWLCYHGQAAFSPGNVLLSSPTPHETKMLVRYGVGCLNLKPRLETPSQVSSDKQDRVALSRVPIGTRTELASIVFFGYPLLDWKVSELVGLP